VLPDTGLKEYASTPGNRGVWVLRRVFEGQGRVHLDHALGVMGRLLFPKTRSFCCRCFRR